MTDFNKAGFNETVWEVFQGDKRDDGFELIFGNGELHLGYTEDGDDMFSTPIPPEKVDSLIKILDNWRTWRNG